MIGQLQVFLEVYCGASTGSTTCSMHLDVELASLGICLIEEELAALPFGSHLPRYRLNEFVFGTQSVAEERLGSNVVGLLGFMRKFLLKICKDLRVQHVLGCPVLLVENLKISLSKLHLLLLLLG